ncbi:MAG: hypothetical protein JNL35_14280 [Sphingopyxis sp.]|nr:hypothetical protein [Sphingopyxis sp.]
MAGGIARYRASMRASKGGLPIGIHIAMLESAGHSRAAQALAELGLRTGEDVSAAAHNAKSPVQSCRDYEALFERGAINARMIARYAASLIELGRGDEAERIFDSSRLLQTVMLDDLTVANEPLAQAVATEIKTRAAAHARPATNGPALDMLRLGKLTDDPGPAVATLLDAVEAEARRYLASWAGSDHPFARHVSDRHVVHAWALISQGPGRLDRHSHKRGWVTCVYYPVGVPAGEAGGALVVGAPEGGVPLAGWPQGRVRPEAGLLVLMPSYYTHWTTPYDAPGLRMSIAVDFELGRAA